MDKLGGSLCYGVLPLFAAGQEKGWLLAMPHYFHVTTHKRGIGKTAVDYMASIVNWPDFNRLLIERGKDT